MTNEIKNLYFLTINPLLGLGQDLSTEELTVELLFLRKAIEEFVSRDIIQAFWVYEQRTFEFEPESIRGTHIHMLLKLVPEIRPNRVQKRLCKILETYHKLNPKFYLWERVKKGTHANVLRYLMKGEHYAKHQADIEFRQYYDLPVVCAYDGDGIVEFDNEFISSFDNPEDFLFLYGD